MHASANTCSADATYRCPNTDTYKNANNDAHKTANANPNRVSNTCAYTDSVLYGHVGCLAVVLKGLRWRFANAH